MSDSNSKGGFGHSSVMAKEVLDGLAVKQGGVYVDGTLGGGGHSKLILEASSPDGFLIGIDRDDDALKEASIVLEDFKDRVAIVKGNFRDIESITTKVIREKELNGIDGIVFDFGVSSYQLDKAERGFSFLRDAGLDMRMDRSKGETAADLVARLSEEDLKNIFWNYGEEKKSLTAAKAIVAAREVKPIETTLELASIIEKAIGPKGYSKRKTKHPATKVFQALRIAVNDELASIEEGLTSAMEVVKPGGRICAISFHSLEDRIVKSYFRELETGCICPKDFPECRCGRKPKVRLVKRRAIKATDIEIESNPRSRSARLRVAEKL